MFEKVKEVLVDALNIEAEEIQLESNLKELGIDSLSVVELVLELETEFDCEISEEELTTLHTVEDIVNLLESK